LAAETAATLLAAVRLRFRAAGLPTADLDARLLVAAALGMPADRVVLAGATPVEAAAASRADALAARRLAGEPVGRILGVREFWSIPFRLAPDVLEPRPDTETVVEAALAAIARRGSRDLTLADLGTGSGAILVALLTELPRATGIGVDISEAAARVARTNAEAAGVGDRALFVVGDFAATLRRGLDLVISNPPYISSDEMAGLSREVLDHDPRRALDGGADGLEAYRAILGRIDELLAPHGVVVLETGAGQAEAVSALAVAAGLEVEEIRADLGGRARSVTARRQAGK
jgi:release factor glutamine methyltransferase